MPITLEDGSEWPTPEETVVALLEQGDTPEEIIAEAERNIADAQDGIIWVDAVVVQQAGIVGDRLESHTLAEMAIAAAVRGGAPPELVKKAKELHAEAKLDVEIASISSGDAKTAADQHRGHATETISNAQRRIAAAQDPELVGPAVKRYKQAKAAEAAALKDGPKDSVFS